MATALLAVGLSAAETPDAAWVADFQRYAAQEGIHNDQPYGVPPNLTLRWADLLKTLPAPEKWEALHAQFAAAATNATDAQARGRLQAGGWFAAYLLGRREEILTSLPAAPDETGENQALAYAAQRLRESLAERERGERPLAEQVKAFEEQLIMFEPVDVEAVKRLLGGEENLARLQRIIAAGQAVQGRVNEIYTAFEKDQDEAAARRKMEELQKEFEAAHGADQAVLDPFQNDPLFRRYVASLYQEDSPRDHAPNLVLPDLVTALGEESAKALLRRALRLPVALVTIRESGESTLKLARELVLADADKLKVASWALAQDVAAGEVFEVLQKRFGEGAADDYGYQQARGYYLVALIQQGRVPAAVELAAGAGATNSLNLPYQVLEALERGGQAQALWDFLRAWLARHPAADEWDRFNRLSAVLDRQEELKDFIRHLADQGAFEGMDRLRVQRMQADAELATDDLSAAEKRLRTLVAVPAGNIAELRLQLELAEKLMQLADLQADEPGFAVAQAAAEALLARGRTLQPEETPDLAATLATALNRHGRLEAGERVSREALGQAAEMKKPAADANDGTHVSEYTARRLATEQLRALTGLGRWAEAERLMLESPWWNAGDAAELLNETTFSDRRPLGWHFAEVLRNRSQPEAAQRILEAQLVATPGVDAVYASYLVGAGQAARPLLAKLAATDRYEERPLIWLAQLQLDAGEWDAAISTLEKAIAIDPSDGEQGRGDRMRVYALLARTEAAKGDAAKAAFLEGVVKAIRLSETADRWFDTGAYARAIRLYREALGFFQDAYCIQSRLAVRLAGEGKMDEAAEHYRRAFELMPDSFGRVESHCFGCEHVFAGEQSQGVAEEVFTRMLAARPEKPQLHYLLGYLRQEQKRPAEAAELYRRAVQLDPLYLNAWNKLAGLDGELKFTRAQSDDLLLKLTELDPARRHVSPDLARVSDLPRLWRALAGVRAVLTGLPAADRLLELPASAMAQSADAAAYPRWESRRPLVTDFGQVLAQQPFVQALQHYLALLNMPTGEMP